MKKSLSTLPLSSAAKFITRRIYDLRAQRTQLEIATAAGFKSPNMLSMIKDGKAKLPLERVIALAKALDCDAGHLMRLALEQTLTQPVLDEIFANAAGPTSANERQILAKIRGLSQGTDPALTADLTAVLAQVLGPTASHGRTTMPRNNLVISAAVAMEVEAQAAQRELGIARQFYQAADGRLGRVEARLKSLRSQLDHLIRGSS